MPNLNSCFFLLLLIPLLRFCWILVPGALSYTRPTNNQPLCYLVFHAMILRLCQGRRPRWLQGDISSLALLVQWGQTQRRALRRIIRSPQTGILYYWNQRMSWTQSHRPVGLFSKMFLGTWLPSTVSFPGFFFNLHCCIRLKYQVCHQTSRFSHAAQACCLPGSPRDLRERHDREMRDHICHSPSEGVFFLKAIGWYTEVRLIQSFRDLPMQGFLWF